MRRVGFGLRPCRNAAVVRVAGASLLLATTLLLQGCAAVLGVTAATVAVGGAAMAVNPDLEGLPREVTNRATFSYPTDEVYAVLTETVASDGRKIVEASPATYTLRVSYPFSFLANNWGGVITITCTADGAGTTLVIIGSGRDTTERLAKIGVEIIHDLRLALARLPRVPPRPGRVHNAPGAASGVARIARIESAIRRGPGGGGG